MKCQICGTQLKDDLFSFVTGEKVCSLCKINHIGGLPTTGKRIKEARERLGLGDGEYLEVDRQNEAKAILGRADR